jgi:hypothetical protein
MSEVQAEGFGASASEASSAAEGVGDVGGWDVGVQWQGPSAEEWQATQQAIGEIASLLGVQEEPESAFDPFADDFAEQVRAVAREEIEPIRETFGQLQQQASLDKGNAELSSIVAGLAAELGADLDEAEVRADAHRRVEGVASGLMVEAGLSAEQISAVLASDPLVAYKILAARFEDEVSSPDEVARWALLTAGRILHEQATKPRSPSEVLRRSFPTQPPGQRSQPAARGPYGVLAKHQKLNEGRRS